MWAIRQQKIAQPIKMLVVLGAVYAKVRIADDQEVLRVDRIELNLLIDIP
jgi:hypothetical protein